MRAERCPYDERLKAVWLSRNMPTVGPIADCREGLSVWSYLDDDVARTEEPPLPPIPKRKGWRRLVLSGRVKLNDGGHEKGRPS